MEFEIILSPKAAKDLDRLSENICKKIINAIQILREIPFPRGKLIKKLTGTKEKFYRLRVDKYRVFYMIESDKVVILRVLSKKDTDRFIQNL